LWPQQVKNECVGIAVLDRARLRLLTMFLGQLREHVAEEFDIEPYGTRRLLEWTIWRREPCESKS
jgi:hypothetical protein